MARGQLALHALNQYRKFFGFMFALGVFAEFANVLGLLWLSESDAVHKGDLVASPNLTDWAINYHSGETRGAGRAFPVEPVKLAPSRRANNILWTESSHLT